MKKFFYVILLAFILAGCSSNNEGNMEHEHHGENTLEPVNVTIQTVPEQIFKGEKVKIQAIVTQGNEAVEDADDVTFEIWSEGEGEEEHEKIAATHIGDGKYEMEKTFEKAAMFTVIAHTNARGVHTMPQITIEVSE